MDAAVEAVLSALDDILRLKEERRTVLKAFLDKKVSTHFGVKLDARLTVMHV